MEVGLPISDDGHYDILPYSTCDNYDTIIDDAVIVDDLSVSFPPRQGSLPTPGYSGLTHSDAEPTAPDVYSTIDNCATPVDIESVPRDTKVLAPRETISKKEDDDSKDRENGERGGNQKLGHPYIGLPDLVVAENISENHVDHREEMIIGKEEIDLQQEVTQSHVPIYIELIDDRPIVADNSEECKRSSDFDIPSTYLTVNF